MRPDWEGCDPDKYNVLEASPDADGDGHITHWLVFGVSLPRH